MGHVPPPISPVGPFSVPHDGDDHLLVVDHLLALPAPQAHAVLAVVLVVPVIVLFIAVIL